MNGVAACRQIFDELPRFDPVPDSFAAFWVPMMRLQGVYLALCSVLERLAMLRAGDMREGALTSAVHDLARDRQFDEAFKYCRQRGQIPRSEVIEVRNGSGRTRFPGSCAGALRYWYDIRSNVVHRGKDSWRDARLLQDAAEGLLCTLEQYVAASKLLPRTH